MTQHISEIAQKSWSQKEFVEEALEINRKHSEERKFKTLFYTTWHSDLCYNTYRCKKFLVDAGERLK